MKLLRRFWRAITGWSGHSPVVILNTRARPTEVKHHPVDFDRLPGA